MSANFATDSCNRSSSPASMQLVMSSIKSIISSLSSLDVMSNKASALAISLRASTISGASCLTTVRIVSFCPNSLLMRCLAVSNAPCSKREMAFLMVMDFSNPVAFSCAEHAAYHSDPG